MGDFMSEDALRFLSEFRAEVPFPADEVARTVYDRAVNTKPQRPTLSRRRSVVAVVAALLVFSAAAVAAVREAPWWQSGTPPVDPEAVVSVARDNMPADVRVAEARTVVTDGDAALVAVPLDETGYCLIPALDDHASLGASCVYSVAHPERGDSDSSDTAVRAAKKDAAARWLAYGRITDPRAAKLDLGSFTVDLTPGGFFLARIPEGEWAKLSGTANPGAILDSSGAVLRRGCVNWGAAPGQDGQGFPVRSAGVLWVDHASGECKPQTVPPPPMLDLSKATTLFDVTLTKPFSVWRPGDRVTFEEAPASDGSMCVVPRGPGFPVSAAAQGCSWRITPPQAGTSPVEVDFGAQLAHAGGQAFYSWQITGSTDPAAKIARLTLSSPASSVDVTYRDNVFFVELPATTPGPRVGNIPFPDGPWTLTGYDATGNEVTHVDLNELHTRLSPH
jgi:hypothetical protein